MDTLELPTGETVTPTEAFHYEGYPYRFCPSNDPDVAFVLSPLYWGGPGMDVPVPSREAFVERWDDASRGVLSEDEWQAWLTDAREDDRYTDDELTMIAAELGINNGLLTRMRQALGL